MIETAIEIRTSDGAVDGLLIQPEKEGHWPGVLYLTYIVGINDASRSMASRLAAGGYAVLLPNIFYRNGKPPIFNSPFKIGDEHFVKRTNEIRAPLTPDAEDRDLSAYVDFLARQPRSEAKHLALSASASLRRWCCGPLPRDRTKLPPLHHSTAAVFTPTHRTARTRSFLASRRISISATAPRIPQCRRKSSKSSIVPLWRGADITRAKFIKRTTAGPFPTVPPTTSPKPSAPTKS